MNTTDTKIVTPVREIPESGTSNLVPINGGREVSLFEKGALELMRRPDANMETLQQFMQMQERWEERQAEKAFVEAMSEFKKNPPKIVKDKLVGYKNNDGTETGYRHATLAAVCDAAIAGLAAVGISHRWDPKQEAGKVGVTCVLTHRLGHSQSTYLEAPADNSGKKNAIQAIASSVTYLERYTLLAATGLATEEQDDDGASHADPKQKYDWVDEYLAAIGHADDLPHLMAAWKTAAGAARRREARDVYEQLQQAVTIRCGELGITVDQWAAAAGKKP